MKKSIWRCHHFKLVQQKTRSYDVCLLRYGEIVFSHLRPFFALLRHYWPRKLKFGKNAKKKHLEILHMCTINCVPLIKIIWYMVPEIWSSTERMFLSYWAIFYLFTFPTPPLVKNKLLGHVETRICKTKIMKFYIIIIIIRLFFTDKLNIND